VSSIAKQNSTAKADGGPSIPNPINTASDIK